MWESVNEAPTEFEGVSSEQLLSWRALLHRQLELQEAGALGIADPIAVTVALVAELGELAQETKATWAWWKKPGDRAGVDLAKILDEASDVLHFLLLIELGYARPGEEGLRACIDRSYGHGQQLAASDQAHAAGVGVNGVAAVTVLAAQHRTREAASALCTYLADQFGFTPEQLAVAYYSKGEVNLARWAEAKQK